MQIIINSQEILASLQLNVGLGKLLSRYHLGNKEFSDKMEKSAGNLLALISMKKAIDSIDPTEELMQCTVKPMFDAALAQLKKELDFSDNMVSITVDESLNMVVIYDSEKMVSILEAITDELPAFGGIVIGIYGVMESFKALSTRLGNRLKSIIG